MTSGGNSFNDFPIIYMTFGGNSFDDFLIFEMVNIWQSYR